MHFTAVTLRLWILSTVIFAGLSRPALAADAHVHGIWVWKAATVLEAPGSAEALRDFCRAKGINEVYASVATRDGALNESRFANAIELLHQSNIRVEALYGSSDADLPGKPREALLEHVRQIVEFNQRHGTNRFDGIHLDIEPHQRPENKGGDNLRFLPDLVATFQAVRALAEPAGMTVNADVASKILKAGPAERKQLLISVPRLTLMLYELSSPDDGKTAAQKISKLRSASDKYLAMTYAGLSDPKLARLSIALRTPDYGDLLPDMLKSVDEAERQNPHYLGWARHSYNDHIKPKP